MPPQVVEVHRYEDDVWRGYVTAATASELLRDHVWVTYVAGVPKYEGADTWCEIGAEVTLVREPDNPWDPNAVSVWTADGRQAGYIPRHTAADMDLSVERLAIVLAEMHIERRRVGLWLLVSRDPVDFMVTAIPKTARGRVEHRVAHLKELTLGSLEGPTDPVDPIESMRIMAEALNHEHRDPVEAASDHHPQ